MSAPQSYYVPVDAGEAEFTEKRSRFLGHVRRVETEAEARAFLDEMRKKYYDARHNCWCYVLHEGGVVRYGDDGEPQGTAGQPMLNVFQLFRRRAARRGRTDARLRKVREGRA